MSWRPRQIPPESFNAVTSRWKVRPFGSKGHVIVRLRTEYDAMTGAAVSENLEIPYPHRICSIQVKHTDGTGANNTTALTAGQFKRFKWQTCAGNSDWFILWNYGGVVGADFLYVCGDGWEYPHGRYQFTTNTTNGHRMYYELIVQILSKKGKEFVS